MIIQDIKANYPQLGILNYYLKGAKGFIAGGCFRSFFEGENPKDIDIFFYSNSDFLESVENYSKGWKKIYENESAIGFYKKGFFRVDLVRSIFGTPIEVLNLFDFTIAKFAMDKEGVFYSDTYWRDLYLKRLVCDHIIPRPIGTFNRAQKYAKYGYFMCRETKVKLLVAIKASNEQDIDTLDKSLYRGWD
jgi:hypothetical protein